MLSFLLTNKLIMTEIVLIYLIYAWIGLLHSFFVGSCLYTFLGNYLIKLNIFLQFLIPLLILAFLELYWKPIFETLGLEIKSTNLNLLSYFSLSKNQNIIPEIKTGFFFTIVWLIQAFIALLIGRWVFKTKIIKQPNI